MANSNKPKEKKEIKQPTVKSLRKKFAQDLEELFLAAFLEGNFSAALKAKELLAKEQGFFEKKPLQKLSLESLKSLSDDVLEHLLVLCEKTEETA